MAGNLFYGFSVLNEKVQTQLCQLVEDLRDTCPRATWTSPGKLHVTLRFLGKTPVETASDWLMGSNYEPFTMQVAGAGYFTNSKGPRVLYAKLQPLNQLRGLYKAFGGEEVFNPHLTIAKLEGRGDFEPVFADLSKNLADHVFGDSLVPSVKLYRTEGDGQPYTVLAEKRLVGT